MTGIPVCPALPQKSAPGVRAAALSFSARQQASVHSGIIQCTVADFSSFTDLGTAAVFGTTAAAAGFRPPLVSRWCSMPGCYSSRFQSLLQHARLLRRPVSVFATRMPGCYSGRFQCLLQLQLSLATNSPVARAARGSLRERGWTGPASEQAASGRQRLEGPARAIAADIASATAPPPIQRTKQLRHAPWHVNVSG